MKNKITELNKFIEDYPDLEVKMFTHIDEICDDFTYIGHEIKTIEISQWLQIDEQIFLSEDELSEYYEDNLGCTEEVARDIARKHLKDVILIYTGV